MISWCKPISFILMSHSTLFEIFVERVEKKQGGVKGSRIREMTKEKE